MMKFMCLPNSALQGIFQIFKSLAFLLVPIKVALCRAHKEKLLENPKTFSWFRDGKSEAHKKYSQVSMHNSFKR